MPLSRLKRKEVQNNSSSLSHDKNWGSPGVGIVAGIISSGPAWLDYLRPDPGLFFSSRALICFSMIFEISHSLFSVYLHGGVMYLSRAAFFTIMAWLSYPNASRALPINHPAYKKSGSERPYSWVSHRFQVIKNS